MRKLASILIVLGVVLPLVPLVIWSFAASWRYPMLIPEQTTDRGLAILAASDVVAALATSFFIATTVAILACAIGFPAGRVIGLRRFRGRRALQFLLLAPVIVPGLAVTLGLQVFFVRLGLSDTVAGVILVQLILTVPYAAIILGAAFDAFDIDLERQSRSLGASPWQAIIQVTVPALGPALAATALLTFLISWSEYILTLLIGGGQVETLPLLLFAAIGSSDTTAAAVLGLLVIAPPVVMVLVVAKAFVWRSSALIGLARV